MAGTLAHINYLRSNDMKRITIALAITLVMGIAGTLHLQAQNQIGVGLMYDSDTKSAGIDGRLVLPIAGPQLRFATNIDVFLPNNYTFVRFDANLQYVFAPLRRGGGAYLLGGLDVGYVSVNSSSNTELGINVGGGISGPVGPLSLFGELKFVLGNFDGIVLGGGLLFDM